MREKSLGHDRAIFMQTCTKKNLSENTQLELSKIIRKSREQHGSEAADEKAAELTELINSCKTEEELLQKLEDIPST